MKADYAQKAGPFVLAALIVFFAPILLQAQLLEEGVTYSSNGIVVAFKAEYAPLAPSLQNGIISTGIPEVDQLNLQYGVYKMWPLFPGAEKRGEPAMAGYYSLRFADGYNLEQVLLAYQNLITVEHVEPIGIHRINYNPNDTYLYTQWAITRIDARQAWDITQGNANIPLGIADTGVDWNHPDLDGNIWINNADPIDGSDNDGNGFIDDYRGWDWVNGETGPSGEDLSTPDNNPMDYNGHGTHVSGIASAETDNAAGVAGVGFDCKIMCLRIGWTGFGGYGYVGMDYAASAFYYAANNDAKSVNCSWGSSNSGGIAAAATYASNNGVLLVSAAGNDNNNTAPYLCTRTDVIAVAATDASDIKADFSNYGSWVDVSAPGVNIYSTYFDNTYAYLDGTSMAAPHVVGLAGLINAVSPSMTRAQVQSRIISTTENINALNPGYSGQLGSGRINAHLAVQGLGVTLGPPILISPISGEWLADARPTLVWRDTSEATNFHIQVDDASSFTSPAINDSIANPDTIFNPPSNLGNGLWYWRVRGGNGTIWSEYSTSGSFRVDTQGPVMTTLLTPAPNSFTNDRTPYFSWNPATDGGSGVAWYYIMADTDSLFTLPLSLEDSSVFTNYTLSFNLPADSRIFWRVRARDEVGNFGGWLSAAFTIDNTAPGTPVGFTISPEGWTRNTPFTLSWSNPSDASGISHAFYKVGSAPISNSDTTGRFAGTPPAVYNASITGANAIYLWLVDGAGNRSYSNAAGDSFYFDNSLPTGSTTTSPSLSSELTFTVNWGGGNDIGSGLAELYDVRYMDSVSGVWTAWQNYTGLTGASFTGQHGHTYFFEARTYDLVGNQELYTGIAESRTSIDTTYIGPSFIPGDVNGNGTVNGIDVIYLVAYLKGGPPPPDPVLRADANGSCSINGIDVVYLVAYLKGYGDAPIAGDCLASHTTEKTPIFRAGKR